MSKKMEYLLIKKKDDFCNTNEQIKSLLMTNTRITSITDSFISIGKYQFKYLLVNEEVKDSKEILFYLLFESVNELDEEKEIEALENIDNVLQRVIETSRFFYLITIWDDVSTYYGTKAYPKINKIENKMRKIIYIFMIRNIGSKWVDKYMPHNVKDSIKKILIKNKTEDMSQDCLYSADFIQLVYFIFNKYPLNNDLQSLVQKLKEPEKLNKVIIEDLVEKYETKSNWDRFFSKEINIDNLEDNWEELYNFRNKVAHNKKIVKNDYENALTILNKLDDAFDECLKRVNQIVITDDEQESIEKVAEQTIDNNVIKDLVDNYKSLSILDSKQVFAKDYFTASMFGLNDDAIKSISGISETVKSFSNATQVFAKDYFTGSMFNLNDDAINRISGISEMVKSISNASQVFPKDYFSTSMFGLNDDAIKRVRGISNSLKSITGHISPPNNSAADIIDENGDTMRESDTNEDLKIDLEDTRDNTDNVD